MNWIPIEEITKANKPKDGSNVFVTVEGYDEAFIGSCWEGKWYLINDFIPKHKGDLGEVNITAFMPIPKAYKK